MDFSDMSEIKRIGFVGFKTMSELFADSSVIPKIKGIYVVLCVDGKKPEFLKVGTGGHYRGKNPNISILGLENEWVEGAYAVYIGKAGGGTSDSTLNSRLNQYFSFGQGKNVPHWGGRLIWQLKNSRDLFVCWKPLPYDEPREIERDLIRDFKVQYNEKRPFANLRD
ncbi:MAG: hypothetical protein KGZ93_11220 [Actinobacteria bacterium]|nr:hypothetical protein [Actinomycetota bacterium]